MKISAGDLADRIQRQEAANAEEKRQQEAAIVEAKRQQEAEAAQKERQRKAAWVNYNVIPPLSFELGYVWEPDYPVGFRVGAFGFYTTWNFYIPDWLGISSDSGSGNHYDENVYVHGLNIYQNIGDREQKSFEWVAGFSINIIDNFLIVPIGIGGRHSLEYGLFNSSTSGYNWIASGKPKAYTENNWESDLLFEIGLEINPIREISLLATYRFIGSEERSYTLGVCYTFHGERQR
jgi:opacity protein-like surface antigen